MRKLQLLLLVLSGCKASAVLDGFGAAKLNTPENATKWAQFSSAPAVRALTGSNIGDVSNTMSDPGACPSFTDDGTTRSFKGDCTSDAGVRWLGSATLVRTASGAKTGTITYANLRSETPSMCGSGSVTAKQAVNGSVTITENGFTVDEKIEQERFETSDCNNAVKETFAFDYAGTSTDNKWNGKGRVGSSLLGTANVETVDEVLNDTMCSSEAASGTTTLRSGNDVVIITYDGATDCDTTSTVKWSLNGEDKGELVGVRCAVTPVSALLFLIPLLLRRRRLDEEERADSLSRPCGRGLG
ncbi:MAG: hypothetical protein JNM17_05690 [Archangium sp.]|nr:hypothetical protein [Archangium sp.]